MRYHLKQRRTGFTLIELIVVISIIVIIASLTLGAVTKSFNWVKQKNTEQVMSKALERIVGRRLTQIYKEAEEWDTPAALYRQAQGDAKRADALKAQYLYKWSFPHTYSEAYYNVLESQVIFDPSGYPLARAIYTRLKSRTPLAMSDAQFTSCPSATEMPLILPKQSSACLLAAFQCMLASSVDEFTSNEATTLSPFGTVPLTPDVIDVPAQAAVLADGTNLAQGYSTLNPMLIDAWGTPFFFMRFGNLWDGLGTIRGPSNINRAGYWMGLRSPAVVPAAAVLGDGYYDILANNPQLNTGRAFRVYSSRWNSDPLDPEGAFRNSEAWRAQNPSGGVTWIASTTYPWALHLCPPSPNAVNTWQHQDFFRSNFGYRPQPSNLNAPGNPPDRWAQEYAPFVIISAGGDKRFNTWDDNLDSYRLRINVSGQQ